MGDGTRLSARIWRPKNSNQAPVPAVLEYIPYRKRDHTRRSDEMAYNYLAAHGFACLRVDMRGSGESEGILEDEYLSLEQRDGIDILNWIGERSWCDGKIGMIGISWGGFNSLQIAALKPAQLKAIITVCSTDDRYNDDVHYMGGTMLADNLSWASIMFARNTQPPDPEIVGEKWYDMWLERLEGSGLWLEKWMRHPWRDEYWKHGSICEDYSAITCPVLAVGGWADGYSNAIFRLLDKLEVPCKGIIGPWSHTYPHFGKPGPAIGFLQETLRWWNHWLKGIDSGIESDPALTVWMQNYAKPMALMDQRPGKWLTLPQWPDDRIKEECFYFNNNGGLSPCQKTEPDEKAYKVQSPLSVGLFGGKWCSYSVTPDLPHDQREADGGSLIFESEPLKKQISILGSPEIELDISANRPVAMVAVRLSEISPDDKASRITYGLLNLTHRDSQE
ncbi:MAG: CocE/NonD family hydrolase, partial [Candidatus Rifleibacteriota bacterium]